MALIFTKIVDIPGAPLLSVPYVDIDTATWSDLAIKLYDVHGATINVIPSGNWKFRYDEMDLKESPELFQFAVQHHSLNRPLLVEVRPEPVRTVIAEAVQSIEIPAPVPRRRRTKERRLYVGGGGRFVDYDTPYFNNVRFGEYIPAREGHPMDANIIDLGRFPDRFKTEFAARLVAYFYAAITYGVPIGVDEEDHDIYKYRSGVVSKLLSRVSVENVVNLCVALTQLGKSVEILLASVFNLFQGRDSLVFLRNNGGNAAKNGFKLTLHRISEAVADYFSTVLNLDIDYYRDILLCINLYEGAKNAAFQRPFIYCERTNPSKIEFPFKTIYQQGGAMMYSIFIDEEDEQRQSVACTVGTSEKSLYTTMRANLENASIYYRAFMTVGFTATPCPVLTAKPANMEQNYRYNLIELPIPETYKGYHYTLVGPNKILLIPTGEKQQDPDGSEGYEHVITVA